MSAFLHQSQLAEWLIEALGAETLNDPQARAMRVLEEAVELAQAVGIPLAKTLEQVYHTYARPAGEVSQEIAGVYNASILAAHGIGLNAHKLGADELRRAWKDIDLIRAKNRTKVQA